MLRKKNNQSFSSVRARQPKATLGESFRRNNVVVSRSQREMAAYRQSVTQRQQDRKKQLARLKARHQALGVIVFVLIAGLLYRQRLTAVEMTSNAGAKLSSPAQQQYQASIMQAYQNQTIASQAWLLDKTGFKAQLLKQYPEIERIEVSSSAPFQSSLKADLRFRKAVFTWKDASNTLQFVDGSGVLFSKNLEPSVSATKLIQIEDQSGAVLDTGTSVLSAQLIQFVGQLHTQLPPLFSANSKVTRVIIPRSTREVQVQMSTQSYLIKFNSTRPLAEQIGELGSLLNYLKVNNIAPSAYLDLRIAHKAFYK